VHASGAAVVPDPRRPQIAQITGIDGSGALQRFTLSQRPPMSPLHRHSHSALILLLALALPPLLVAQQPRPNGAWRLDAAHSDSMAATFKGGESPQGPPPGERPGDPGYGPPGASGPGVGGGMGGGRRFGGGRYGRGGSEKDVARMRQTLELGRHAAERVMIEADSGRLTTIDADGAAETYPIDGKAVTQSIEGASDVKTKVHWKGDALQVERKVAGGGRVTESYGLGLDGTRMIVYVEVDLGMMQRSYTRRYLPGTE
jgi:hypothetical protein